MICKIEDKSELVPLIDRACSLLPYRYDSAIRKLMLGTAATESNLVYRVQIGGPARGLWQMEPATAISIYSDYLRYRPGTYNIIAKFVSHSMTFEVPSVSAIASLLQYNDIYACMMARIKYGWDKYTVPTTLEEIAQYYKRVYNTYLGKGSAEKFLRDWKYCNCDALLKEAGDIA